MTIVVVYAVVIQAFLYSAMSETNLTVLGELRDQLSPVLTSDASISISTSIRSLYTSESSEDGRDISISISIRLSKPCVLHAYAYAYVAVISSEDRFRISISVSTRLLANQ